MPKAKIQKQERAKKLRKQGWSINDIAKELEVSKGSVSHWCRDIELTEQQLKKLQEKAKREGTKALLKAAEKRRKERIERTKKLRKKGAEEVGELSRRDLFIAGLALYWGEGYKKGNDELGFTNSDPEIIKLFIRWLNEIYDVPKDRLILRVSINQIHQDRIEDVKNFWREITGVEEGQFTKTSFIKTKLKKKYSDRDDHYGTLRVKVSKGADLRRRILGSIDALE